MSEQTRKPLTYLEAVMNHARDCWFCGYLLEEFLAHLLPADLPWNAQEMEAAAQVTQLYYVYNRVLEIRVNTKGITI